MDISGLLFHLISLGILFKLSSALSSTSQNVSPKSWIRSQDPICICYPPNDSTYSVPQALHPNENDVKRLVVFVYMGSNPKNIKMYIPGLEKQQLIPELPLEDDDNIVTAPNVHMEQIFNGNPNVIEINDLPQRRDKTPYDKLPISHPGDKTLNHADSDSENNRPSVSNSFSTIYNPKQKVRPENIAYDSQHEISGFPTNSHFNKETFPRPDKLVFPDDPSLDSDGDSNKPNFIVYPKYPTNKPNDKLPKPDVSSKYPTKIDKDTESGELPDRNNEPMDNNENPNYYYNQIGPTPEHPVYTSNSVVPDPEIVNNLPVYTDNQIYTVPKTKDKVFYPSSKFSVNIESEQQYPNTDGNKNKLPESQETETDLQSPKQFITPKLSHQPGKPRENKNPINSIPVDVKPGYNSQANLQPTKNKDVLIPVASDESPVIAFDLPTSTTYTVEAGDEKVLMGKFDEWLSIQLEMMPYRAPNTIDVKSIKNVIEKTLSDNGMHMNKDGILKDSDGNKLDIDNLMLRPLLIGKSVNPSNIWNVKKADNEKFQLPKDSPYLEGLLISLVYPPKVLGIIPLGLTYLSKDLPILIDSDKVLIDSPRSQQAAVTLADKSSGKKYPLEQPIYFQSNEQETPEVGISYLQGLSEIPYKKPQLDVKYKPGRYVKHESDDSYEKPKIDTIYTAVPGVHDNYGQSETTNGKPTIKISNFPGLQYGQEEPEIYGNSKVVISQLPLHDSSSSSAVMADSATKYIPGSVMKVICVSAACRRHLRSRNQKKMQNSNYTSSKTRNFNFQNNNLTNTNIYPSEYENENQDNKPKINLSPTDFDFLVKLMQTLKTGELYRETEQHGGSDKIPDPLLFKPQPKEKDKKEVSALEEDQLHEFRIIGGNAATSSGTPVSNKGRSGIIA